MKLFDQLTRRVFPDNDVITEEIIDYYENSPDELNLIINKEYFHTVFLGIFFAIGISVTLLARLVQYLYGDQLGDFINTVILDVISELGIAIFGGAVVAYLIEFLNKRQYQRNLRFRNQIKAKLTERKKKALSGPTGR